MIKIISVELSWRLIKSLMLCENLSILNNILPEKEDFSSRMFVIVLIWNFSLKSFLS